MRDRHAVPAEVMRRNEQLCAETFDLQPASRLRAEALQQSMRRQHEERNDHNDRDPGESEERFERTPFPAQAPRPDQDRRQKDDGIHLRGERDAEHGARRSRPACQEQRDGGDRQQRRPGVVRVQRDGTEGNRRHGDEEHRSPQPDGRRAEARQHERDEHE